MNRRLLYKEYQSQFKRKKRRRAIEIAWKNRDFEIGLYWKRAAYFWTLIAAAFAGYFALISSDDKVEDYYVYVILNIGLILSFAWFRVNQGSKFWQENWEKHIDMLEDKVTGPIYKTVLVGKKSNPSVSGVNLKVSLFISFIWVYLLMNKLLNEFKIEIKISLLILILGTFLFLLSLFGVDKKVMELLKGPKYLEFERREQEYRGGKKV